MGRGTRLERAGGALYAGLSLKRGGGRGIGFCLATSFLDLRESLITTGVAFCGGGVQEEGCGLLATRPSFAEFPSEEKHCT